MQSYESHAHHPVPTYVATAFWLGALASGESGMTTDLSVTLHAAAPADAPIVVWGDRAKTCPRADDPRYWQTHVHAADTGGRLLASAAITFVAVRGAARRLAAALVALNPAESDLWRAIDRGADEALARGAHEVFVWASPQICRDGYVRLPMPEEDTMQAFDDIPYPLALGMDATIAPEFSTTVAVTASGFERRNSLWSDARLRFDVGPGIRSEAELGELIAFFRARRGAARGFRLRDPSDFSSHGMTGAPTAIDQLLGVGDGTTASFPLVKRYGSGDDCQVRRITRPVAGSLSVSADGASVSGWTLDQGGVVTFAVAPAAGVMLRAGFLFDVPVRFAEDRLEIAGAAFAAGEAPSVPVVEVREAA